jgi:hypothetical protein
MAMSIVALQVVRSILSRASHLDGQGALDDAGADAEPAGGHEGCQTRRPSVLDRCRRP